MRWEVGWREVALLYGLALIVCGRARNETPSGEQL